ncbi:MAG: branched-chain amino acid ABC transporter permease [Spirochaetes bacterium]|nr:branched-chain amino acid ABC transporter permease [Spirochaetota bacterium]
MSNNNKLVQGVDQLFSPLRKSLGNKYYPVIFGILFIILQILFSTRILNPYIQQIIMLILINIVMTVSLAMINGFTGQFSIGHAAFMALGAYTSIFVTTILGELLGNVGLGFSIANLLYEGNIIQVLFAFLIFFISLILGGAMAGLGGYIIGLPTLRLKGDYLAIVTMAFCEVIRTIIRVSDFLGGPRGVGGIPKFIGTNTFFIVFFFAVISVYFMRNYLFSSFGRASKAIRDNEISAEAMGINTTRQKISVFVIAAVFAGVCGGLYAHLLVFIHPDNFTFMKSLDYLIFLYVGGSGTISGAITGATIFTIVPEFFRFLDEWRMVIYPLILIIVMLARTEGLISKEFRMILPKKLREIREKKRLAEAGEGGNNE